jgi:hypothetical protein
MAFPGLPNTTCDIYRSGGGLPASPDVAGVSCRLSGNYARGVDTGEGDPDTLKFTHVLLVDVSVDVRDSYSLGAISSGADAVWVPDKNGVRYDVIFVERRLRGTALDHKRVYLVRRPPTWPSDDI